MLDTYKTPFCYTFFDETIAENQKADEPTRTYSTT